MTELALIAAESAGAKNAKDSLSKLYKFTSLEKADVIIALGGDGFMLHSLHRFKDLKKPIYGMNRGTIGFLMNDYSEENLLERVQKAVLTDLHPLRMKAKDAYGEVHESLALNEVSMLRETRQAAHLRIRIDGVVRMEEMICDGVVLATPAGSTAYNLSAQGPILPMGSEVLALTPISPFRPRRWRGAILPNSVLVEIEVLDHQKRPVSAVADHLEVRDVRHVEIIKDHSIALTMLFDKGHGLEERIIKEQFTA